MVVETFGAAVGRLVYEKRKALGLTQTQLAEDAYGSGGKTRRISELENGQVANPHPKTIDPIISVLNISEAELAACAARTSTRPDPDLDRAYREAKNLIEVVAYKFEHANPNASLRELEDFLRAKATEWSDLRQRILDLEAPTERIKLLRHAALDALDAGNLSEADDALSQAELVQQETAVLEQIYKLIDLRVTRGDISLFEGRTETAAQLYISAANYIRPFSHKEFVDLLQALAYRVYESGRRSLISNFDAAKILLEKLLTDEFFDNKAFEKSKLYYRLSLIYRSIGRKSKNLTSLECTEKAVHYAKSALDEILNFCNATTEEEIVFHRISVEIALANALYDLFVGRKETEKLDNSLQLLNKIYNDLNLSGEFPELLGHASNSLALVLRAKLTLANEVADINELDKLVSILEASSKAAERCLDFEVLGVSKVNIGSAYLQKADIVDNVQEAQFLRFKSICCYLEAIETFPFVNYPVNFAEAHRCMAYALFQQAISFGSTDAGNSELFLARSLASYEVASRTFDRENYPTEWGDMRLRMAQVVFAHSKLPGVKTAKSDVEQAFSYLEAAESCFVANSDVEGVEHCKQARERMNTLGDDD